MILRATLILLAFHALGAAACDDLRLKTDRYYGAFRACIKSTILDSRDLDEAIASAKPFHPLKKHTPDKKAIIAKSLFNELASDPTVAEHWAETQARLRVLRAEVLGQEQTRQTAERDTRKVIAPTLIHEFEGAARLDVTVTKEYGMTVAWANGGKEAVISRADGRDISRIPLPPDFQYWTLVWHHDASDKLWLYALAIERQGFHVAWTLHRWQWGTNTGFVKIAFDEVINNTEPYKFFSIGKGHLLLSFMTAEKNRVFNVDSDRPVEIPAYPRFASGAQTAAVTQSGKLVTQHYFDGDPVVESVFTTSSGRTLWATAATDILQFRGGGYNMDLKKSARANLKVKIYESPDGEPFVALLQETGDEHVYHIYRPEKSNEPVYSIPLKYKNPHLGDYDAHFFVGPHRRMMLALNVNEVLRIHDLDSKSEFLQLPIDKGLDFHYWFDHGEQTFFWLRSVGGIQLFKFFDEGRP